MLTCEVRVLQILPEGVVVEKLHASPRAQMAGLRI